MLVVYFNLVIFVSLYSFEFDLFDTLKFRVFFKCGGKSNWGFFLIILSFFPDFQIV